MSRIKRKHGPGGGLQGADLGKSRKERRKDARTLKKQLKANKQRRQQKKEIETPPPQKVPCLKEEQVKPTDKKDEKAKKAKKEAERNRRRRLKEDNLQEEANIKQLSKKLGLNKRKSKKPLPKSFLDDGLDFLLDAVDSEKLQNGLISEGDHLKEEGDVESESDFQEFSGDEENIEMEDEESEVSEVNEEQFFDDDDDDGMMEEDDLEEDEEEQIANESEELTDSQDELSSDEEEIADSEPEETIDDEQPPSTRNKVDSKGNWEDIYGRKRDSEGNVISTKSYVPPALRNSTDDSAKSRLKKKMKGLLNRLAESNMHSICIEIESLFSSNSRRDTNAALSELLTDACISPVLTPERLAMEHVLLVAILNANVGTEVGAHFLHHIVTHFDMLYVNADLDDSESKELDCCLLLIGHMYAFKVVDSPLIFDILAKLIKSFQIKDVELILLLLKTVGFNLRKDNPLSLKTTILEIQSASSASQIQDSRTKFMIEILMAIKNNNVKKIPNYDPELQPHYKKIMKNFLRPGASSPPLSVRLQDLLKADQKGRWWIVGSAWAGKENEREESTSTSTLASTKEKQFSSQLLNLARKMRMNTSSRKNIFCNVMSSEDYLDAFERLMKLKNIPNKEREISFVLQDCCLQEKSFNPFYFQVIAKLSSVDRKYRMATQCSLWDKIKDLESLSLGQRNNLAEYTSSLILKFSLPLSVLKVITFADVNKPTISFLKSVLSKILESPEDVFRKVLTSVVGHSQLKDFRESITIFMKHFMVKHLKENPQLKGRIALSEAILRSKDSRTYF